MFTSRILAIFRSFYDPKQYREAALTWQGFGGVYLMIVAALCAAIMYVPLLMTLSTVQKAAEDSFFNEMPDMVISNGTVEVKGEQPAIAHMGKLSMIVDTNMPLAEMRKTEHTFGIGRDFVFFQLGDNYRMHKLTNEGADKPVEINQNTVRDMFVNGIPTVKIIALPMMWGGQLVNLIVAVLMVAVASYLITSFMQEEFFFLTRMRMAALAITPATLITMALQLVMYHQSAPWLPILLSCLYLYVMIVMMRRLGPTIIEVDNTASPTQNG